MNRVLVTGSSGNVGREVMKALRQVGIAARGTYSNLPREELEDSTQFNFLDKETWGASASGRRWVVPSSPSTDIGCSAYSERIL